jgi:hypothetical protein
LAIIDAMDDAEIVCKVVPTSQDYAEQLLAHDKRIFQGQDNACAKGLTKHQAKYLRLGHQWWAINKEIEGCGDHERRNHLQAQQDEISAKYAISDAESQKYADSLRSGNMMPLDAYIYHAYKSNIFQWHASLLLAQKEKAEKEIQWLQEKQALLAQLKEKDSIIQTLRKRPISQDSKKITDSLDMNKFAQLSLKK